MTSRSEITIISAASITRQHTTSANWTFNSQDMHHVFHNLRKYDAHLFVSEFGFDEVKITCTPKTDGKNISFSKKVRDLEMNFIDLFRFMPNTGYPAKDTMKDEFRH